jgi:Tfp pilus assembly protein PilN
MIRINLSQKKKPSYVSGGISSTKADSVSSGPGIFQSIVDGSSGAIMPLLSAMGLPAVMVIGGNYAYDHFVQKQQVVMQDELKNINQEKEKINKELAKIKGFDSVKTELDRNALIVRTKIDTIESLIQGRDFTAKALIALSQSLPKDVWVTEVSQAEKTYEIKGGTTDIGLISDFMSRLGRSIYYKDITLKSTSSEQSGFQATFNLTARRD